MPSESGCAWVANPVAHGGANPVAHFLKIWLPVYTRASFSISLNGKRDNLESVKHCQHSKSRRLWPSYQLFHKPAGRDDTAADGGHADFCQLHLVAGHGTPQPAGAGGAEGEYDFMYDASWFYSSDTEGRPAGGPGAEPSAQATSERLKATS